MPPSCLFLPKGWVVKKCSPQPGADAGTNTLPIHHPLVFLNAQLAMAVTRACLENICAQSTFVEELDAKEKGKRELAKVCIVGRESRHGMRVGKKPFPWN